MIMKSFFSDIQAEAISGPPWPDGFPDLDSELLLLSLTVHEAVLLPHGFLVDVEQS